MLIKEALLMKDFWTIEEHRLHCVDHGYSMYFSLRPGVPKLCGGRGRKLKYTLRKRGFMHHCPQHCQQILGFGYCDTLMANCDRYLERHLKDRGYWGAGGAGGGGGKEDEGGALE